MCPQMNKFLADLLIALKSPVGSPSHTDRLTEYDTICVKVKSKLSVINGVSVKSSHPVSGNDATVVYP